jgi:hypothetical protein
MFMYWDVLTNSSEWSEISIIITEVKYSSVTETMTFPAEKYEQNRCIHFTETCARFLQRDMSASSYDGNKVTILKVQEETRWARGRHYGGCVISCSKTRTYESFWPGYGGSLSSQQFIMLIIQRHYGCSPIFWYYPVSKYSIQTSSLC